MKRPRSFFKKSIFNSFLSFVFLFSIKSFNSFASDYPPGKEDQIPALCDIAFNPALKDPRDLERALTMKEAVLNFATENDLPITAIEVGWPGMRSRRLAVAIDIADKQVMEAYREAFHLNQEIKAGVIEGTLAIEYQNDFQRLRGKKVEKEAGYATLALRHSPDPKTRVFRGDNKQFNIDYDIPWNQWFSKEWMLNFANAGAVESDYKGIIGFSHLIGITGEQVANVTHYLQNPNDRIKPFKENCAYWATSLELEGTIKQLPKNKRRYLAHELGFARTWCNMQTSRLFMHAANQKHVAMVVFVKGKKGQASFQELQKHVPPLPKNFRKSITDDEDRIAPKVDALAPNDDLEDGFEAQQRAAAHANNAGGQVLNPADALRALPVQGQQAQAAAKRAALPLKNKRPQAVQRPKAPKPRGGAAVAAAANAAEVAPPQDLVVETTADDMLDYLKENLPQKAEVRLFFPIGAGASSAAFETLGKLAKHRQEQGQGVIHVDLLVSGIGNKDIEKVLEDAPINYLRLRALFLGRSFRPAYQEGKIQVVETYLSQLARWIKDPEKTDYKYDAIIARTSRIQDQAVSLGTNGGFTPTILAKGAKANKPPLFIAEIHEDMPRTYGIGTRIPLNRINFSFSDTAELPNPTALALTEVERNIGENLAQLIADNSYLQLGIGHVFEGLADALSLAPVKGLRIRSEMFSDTLMKLMEDGMVLSAQAGFAFGSESLYQWLDNNPDVSFVPFDVINDPRENMKLSRLHAINTGLEVNLAGDVNATHVDTGRISSPGGQVEFMEAASRSPGGKAIIAIRSTAKNKAKSSIVFQTYGGHVTTPGAHVDYVVTEYGSARLEGQTEKSKAIELISVAHPKFRKKLFADAKKANILTDNDERFIVFEEDEI